MNDERQADAGARQAREAEVGEPAAVRRAARGRQRVDDQPPHREARCRRASRARGRARRVRGRVVEHGRDRPQPGRAPPTAGAPPTGSSAMPDRPGRRDRPARPSAGRGAPSPSGRIGARRPSTSSAGATSESRMCWPMCGGEQVAVADRVERRDQRGHEHEQAGEVGKPVADAGTATAGASRGPPVRGHVEPGGREQHDDEDGVDGPARPGRDAHRGGS